MPETMPNSEPWPRVSIVTPSYNQAQFLEETIRSVLLQGYPDLEYIIIDGGSTDGSVDIIRKYEPWLAYWVSERDKGQSDAINKGWQKASGEFLAWLNSDDCYQVIALETAIDTLTQQPNAGFTYGNCLHIDAEGTAIYLWESSPFDFEKHLLTNLIPQPTVFMRRELVQKTGGLRTELHYAFDYEFWLRLCLLTYPIHTSETLARFRVVSGTKTTLAPEKFALERLKIYDEFFQEPQTEQWAYLKSRIFARTYWRAGLGFYLNANYKQARHYFEKAFQAGILMDDNFITKTLFAFRGNIDAKWIKRFLDSIPIPTSSKKKLKQKVWDSWYTSQFYKAARERSWEIVRYTGSRLIINNPYYWLRNRGFLSLYIESWIGSTAARLIRKFTRVVN